ncbi:hypothetical protein BT63DRAFT_453506 [Microthyrium microscopicum]|uniref:Fungal N-terminal domain-containing protein n=1 Tax=Microthyrium microscopicum TaxID=703497 RepID=A0A6A6UHT7_9PEZI|nr:hypothetical protein BT63DRAFT_453506 [Microthyrium microscopicum]
MHVYLDSIFISATDTSTTLVVASFTRSVAGFGFSVGDSIAGQGYRDLIRELYVLERAPIEVKQLDVHESLQFDKSTIEQAACQSQEVISAFLGKIEKYNHSLRLCGSGSTLKDSLKKMQWSLNKKDDIKEFQARGAAHSSALVCLLSALQIISKFRQATLSGGKYSDNLQCFQDLKVVITGTEEVSLRSFALLTDMQRQLPPQVHLLVVYLTDACGAFATLSLDLIDSWVDFDSALENRFRNMCSGKILRREYVLDNPSTKAPPSPDIPWSPNCPVVLD